MSEESLKNSVVALQESFDSLEKTVLRVKAERDLLLEAAKNLMRKYDRLPDGPIMGNTFVNGDFFKLRDAISCAEKL